MRLPLVSVAALSFVAFAGCTRKVPPPEATPTQAPTSAKRAARTPPAAKAARHATLAFPELSAHLPSKNVPGEANAAHPCGTAHVEGGDQPLECFDEASTRIDEAARPVIVHATLTGGRSGPLPRRERLRSGHLLDPLDGHRRLADRRHLRLAERRHRRRVLDGRRQFSVSRTQNN